MEKLSTLQKGLLDWLWLSETESKSLGVIERRCTNFYAQFYPDEDRSMAKYILMFPLLRSGVLEFYGQNQYGIAPSCALKLREQILLVNPPYSIIECIDVIPVQLFPGLYLHNYSKKLGTKLRALNIPCNAFSLGSSISQFSSVENIVQSWRNTSVSDPRGYLIFKDKWMAYSELSVHRVYKKSNEANAHRLCLLNSDTWKVIPSRETNPDAFALAVLWSKIKGDQKLKIEYYSKKKMLVINENVFPFLIERLILIHALLNGAHQEDLLKREYFMERSHFRILNKLMGYKIELHHE